MTPKPNFDLAESGDLGNDLVVGRENVRDGTMQAVKWLAPGLPAETGGSIREREVV